MEDGLMIGLCIGCVIWIALACAVGIAVALYGFPRLRGKWQERADDITIEEAP